MFSCTFGITIHTYFCSTPTCTVAEMATRQSIVKVSAVPRSKIVVFEECAFSSRCRMWNVRRKLELNVLKREGCSQEFSYSVDVQRKKGEEMVENRSNREVGRHGR